MKAVVMAGGEGTRLRPLTSNQPKPMVSIVGKPCMEHILELLREHGFEEVIVTVAFLPQAIRTYFGSGDSLGLEIEYSVEETPLGTAGSVRLASDKLDDTFLVISGDALCDFDLSSLVRFHQRKGSSATIGLKSVANPLEFGIVVTDEDGKIERFLEKPSWGQVFSDTINTGVYVLEPEVLRHVPTDRPFDFSKELFPLLLDMGRPMYGCVLDGYWQDIGNLDQYRQANFDALEERVRLNIPGIRLRGNIWIGEGVDADLDAIEGPSFVGNNTRIGLDASVGPYAVLANGVTLRDAARVSRSIVDAGSYLGRSTLVEGAIVGRSCDLRAHVRVHERVAIGDEVTVGAESVLFPGVRIYPYKEVETGSQIFESLIWESRATTHLFAKSGVEGMVNVDLTPEVAVRLASALGTSLKRGARVVASREGTAACRVVKRAMTSGLNATGVGVADLRVLPSGVARHLLKSESFDAGFHVGVSPTDAEAIRIQFFEPPGIEAGEALQKEIEKHYTRRELRRMAASDVGNTTYPARVRESYSQDLLAGLDVGAVQQRGFRVVIDYGFSASSYVLPLVLGPLGVEVVSAHAFPSEADGAGLELEEALGQVQRLVKAIGADLGAAFDRPGERLHLVDERGEPIPSEKALLLLLRLLGSRERSGRVAFPVTATSQLDRLAEEAGFEIVRTRASLAGLTQAATAEGVVFAGAPGGGYVFPRFLPAYDAVASLAHLLELLATVERPVSELVAELPEATLVRHDLSCAWALKGTVMRVLNERFADRDVDVTDGIKIFDERGWAGALPDPDEPVIHVYAEGETSEASHELADELTVLIEEIQEGALV
jgi:mannose-1-phosphate guanylyltransferase/phosphomannomutase